LHLDPIINLEVDMVGMDEEDLWEFDSFYII
jgi:hypothetical protein